MYRLEDLDDLNIHSPTVRLLLLEIGLHADRRKGVLRMSQQELASHTGLSRVTVNRALGRLEDEGILTVKGHGRYQITREELPEWEVGAPIAKAPPGAGEELKRLLELKEPGEGIAYTEKGWPVLIDVASRRRPMDDIEE